MHCVRSVSLVLVVGMMAVDGLPAADPGPSLDAVRAAVSKAIPLLEQGSRGSAEARTCFTCHNQALPILALSEARAHGFSITDENLDRQLEHTAAHLARGRENYLEGRGQGGNVITAGYALWALDAGGRNADDTTAAVTAYLLVHQKEADHWTHRGQRPPSSGSDFMATYVALRGLSAFGTPEQQEAIAARTETVTQWLLKSIPADTEDRVFHYRALRQVGADDADLKRVREELIASQRDDGGWAQTAERESDAYATATVLVALLEANEDPDDSPAVQRGIEYLLDTQLDDGSWHVVTRADPFQTYYESGFPHGTDQFISITASSWATLALLHTLPRLESSL